MSAPWKLVPPARAAALRELAPPAHSAAAWELEPPARATHVHSMRRARALEAALVALGAAAVLRLGLSVAAPPEATAGAWERCRIDPSTAPAHELALLPGLGPARASALVEERRRGGAFRDLHDLARVPGLGEKTLEQLAPFVRFGERDGLGAPAKP